MKKYVKLALCGMAAAALVTGCGKKNAEETTAAPIESSTPSDSTEAAAEKAAKEAEEAEKETKETKETKEAEESKDEEVLEVTEDTEEAETEEQGIYEDIIYITWL